MIDCQWGVKFNRLLLDYRLASLEMLARPVEVRHLINRSDSRSMDPTFSRLSVFVEDSRTSQWIG